MAIILVAIPAGLAANYALASFVLGWIPINAEFRSASSGIQIVIINNGIHVDFLLPIDAAGHDWREVFDPAATQMGAELGSVATHVVIGWGHRDFYVNTPTWADLTASTVVKAVFGIGGTVMHVAFGPGGFDPKNGVSLVLTPADYRRLVEGIVDTAVIGADGRAIPLEVKGYTETDAFYEARGRYNALHTCNNWASAIMAGAGIRVPLWSPFSGAVMNHIGMATAN